MRWHRNDFSVFCKSIRSRGREHAIPCVRRASLWSGGVGVRERSDVPRAFIVIYDDIRTRRRDADASGWRLCGAVAAVAAVPSHSCCSRTHAGAGRCWPTMRTHTQTHTCSPGLGSGCGTGSVCRAPTIDVYFIERTRVNE